SDGLDAPLDRFPAREQVIQRALGRRRVERLLQHQVGGVGEHAGPQNGMASSGKSSPADCCGACRCAGLCALPPPSPRPPTSVTSRTFSVTYVLPSCSRVPISPVTPSCEPFVMYCARRSPRSPHREQSSQTVCLLSPQP